MTEKNDGGPAFPVPAETWNLTGMSLRDYFAAKAMQGMLPHPKTEFQSDDIEYLTEKMKSCYKIADAMLKAREEK